MSTLGADEAAVDDVDDAAAAAGAGVEPDGPDGPGAGEPRRWPEPPKGLYCFFGCTYFSSL
jgi:hypothetical protein